MQLAVFGATGETGRALVAFALKRGWNVRAFVRTQAHASLALPPGLSVVRGNPERSLDIDEALRGCDAVCCAIGPRKQDPRPFCAAFTQLIVERMLAARIRRIVCLTCAMAGDLAGNIAPALRARAALARRRHPAIMADRAAQEAVIARSALDWTLVKPPRLTDAARSGTVHADAALPLRLVDRIGRPDLAEFMFRAATQDRFVRQRVYVRN
jgi:uncharacterized protein YbjT (DUF2867 family)